MSHVSDDLAARRDAAAAIVAEASRMALDSFARRDAIVVDAKKPADFVSEADRAVERFVRQALAERFPGEPVVGEEEGGVGGERFWIVDPIDGTSNFLAGSPLWGVSLGYVAAGEAVAGAVSLPVLGEHFAAAAGQGVLRNGAAFARAPAPADLRLVSVGDSDEEALDASLTLHRRLRVAGWVVECFHSTTAAMIFAALGRFEGHIQPVTALWDIAGSAAICREAGLQTLVRRHEDGRYGIWCGTPALLRDCGVEP